MHTTPGPMPTLSIIVPAYNAAGFIEDCLGAILPQMGAAHEIDHAGPVSYTHLTLPTIPLV